MSTTVSPGSMAAESYGELRVGPSDPKIMLSAATIPATPQKPG